MPTADPSRLRLRPLRLADWPAVHDWARTEIASRYQPWGPNTPEETKAFVVQAVAAWEEHPRRRHVFAAVGDDAVVGTGELQVHSARVASIGYGVHPELWGRGIGTALGRLLRDAAFERLAVHRVEATCDPRNAASEAVLRALGMTHEGTLRENLQVRGGWRDSHVFGLLEHEWRCLTTTPVGDRVAFC